MNTFKLRQRLVSAAFCAGGIAQAGTYATDHVPMKARSVGFEVNEGQAASNVRFIQRAGAYTVLAKDHGLDLQLKSPGRSSLHMEFAGAAPASRLSSADLLPGRINYLKGNNPAAWRRNIPTFARIEYNDLYPGVTASLYNNGGQLEYDIAVQPGSNLSVVTLSFSSKGKRIERTLAPNGDLLCHLENGEVRIHKPVVYQTSGSSPRQFLEGQFALRSSNDVGFVVPRYDHTKALIIDPVVTYSTYLGGGDDEGIFGIKQDASGNLYVAGETSSIDFPNVSATQKSYGGGEYDGFVSKFDRTGTQLIYSTYLGGNGYDHCNGLVLATDGSVSVAGITQSSDFPTVNAVQTTLKGSSDAFVTHLDASGSQLLFSTYLGGSSSDHAGALALGPDQSIYVTGQTQSLDFPVTRGVIQPACGTRPGAQSCGGDAFVTRFDRTGLLLYSTYLGGTGSDSAADVAVDEHGQAFIAGTTSSKDFPVERAYQPANGGGTNAFLSRLSADGSHLVFSTYFGGIANTSSFGLALDQDHNAYLVGITFGSGLPLLNAFQPVFGGGPFDGFIAKFGSKGQLAYSSCLGGSSDEFAFRVTVNGDSQATIMGLTSSLDFPVLNPLQAGFGGGVYDAFITKVAASGSLNYSTYLGGSGDEFGYSIYSDAAGGVWIGGSTSSQNFPLLHPLQPAYAGGPFDAFLTHIEDPGSAPAAPTCSLCQTRPAH